MIAQNIGAEKYERVPRIIGVSFALDSVVAMILSVVTLLFPRTVFGFFTQDEAVLDMAISYIPVAVLMYASCVLRPPMTQLGRGAAGRFVGAHRPGLCDGPADGAGHLWFLVWQRLVQLCSLLDRRRLFPQRKMENQAAHYSRIK